MANPVGQHQIAAPHLVEAPRLNPEVPLGAAAAPTTLQPGAPAAQGPSYVQTFLSWLWNWGSWLFQKVFFCCAKAEEPVLEPPPAVFPPELAPLPPSPILVEGIREQVNFLNRFRELPEREQNFIYFQIGLKKARFWYRISYEDLGRLEVQKNPLILRDYLVNN